jgi:glycosyltransferase involved in cell wall biosynthesis
LKSLKRHGVPLPDVIQAHSAWPTGMAAVAVAERLGRPFVVTFHIEDDPRLVKRSGRRGLYSTMLQQASALVVVGSPLSRALGLLGLTVGSAMSKVQCIANGVDLIGVQAAVEAVDGLKSGWGDLVSVSNLWPTKGIHLNLEALARLSGQGVVWRSYTVVGEGPERPRLEALARRLGIAEKVKFTGRLRHSEALRCVAAADVFSLPSWKESFGIVYVEAMACGKPVVGVLGQGAEDIFRHGGEGFLVPPQDVAGLAEVLGRLLVDEHLARKLGEAGKQRAGGFTWKKNTRQYLELYEHIFSSDALENTPQDGYTP